MSEIFSQRIAHRGDHSCVNSYRQLLKFIEHLISTLKIEGHSNNKIIEITKEYIRELTVQNTIESVKKAGENSCAAEIDVIFDYETKQVFVIHSIKTLRDLTGKPALTLKDIQNPEERKKYPLLEICTVPTLDELFLSLEGSEVPLLIEVKASNVIATLKQASIGNVNDSYIKKSLETIKAIATTCNYKGKIAIQSFSPSIIQAKRDVGFDVPVGLLMVPNLFGIYNKIVGEIGDELDFISICKSFPSRNIVNSFLERKNDGNIFIWTITSHDQLKTAFDFGAHAVITEEEQLRIDGKTR